MKTLKTLLKAFLYGEDKKEKEPESVTLSDAPTANDAPELNNPINSQNNNSDDERETDETHRNPDMVSSSSKEIDSDDENNRQTAGGESTGESGGESTGELNVESVSFTEADIEEAYQRGVTEGRNQQIETMFFQPKENIPHFRGTAIPQSPASDIFSLAREA